MDEDKDKKKKRLVIIILIIIILLLLLLFLSIRLFSNNKTMQNSHIGISLTQTGINIPKKEYEDEYTEIVGYGLIEVYKKQPNIFLINPEGNTVYLQFDVYNKADLLYSSKLIEPNKMEEVDVYDLLEPGQYTLTYSITSYDLQTKELLMSGLNQEQSITIRK